MKKSLRSWLWRVPIDQEIDEELALHLDMRTRELVAGGMDPAAARALAVKKLGDVGRLKREMSDLGRKRDREMSIALWLEELRDDVKFAFRQLKNSPAFTLVAVLTLALGIGANSAIFALVDAALLRPLPYGDSANAGRLVTIFEATEKTQRGFVSPPNMQDWDARNHSFEKIAGFTPAVGQMATEGADGIPETVSRQWVTQGIFDALGVKPIFGRWFSADDEQKRANVLVLSEPYWRRRYNGDPSIVGKQVRFDGILWEVVGIAPKDFELLGQTSMWAMRPFVQMPPRARASYILQVVGRMKPGVTIDAAEADLKSIAGSLATEYPQFNKGRSVALQPMHDWMIGSDLRTTSMLFLGVVGFVLLICCANVANLLMARATVRSRELAVRSALGAGRRRIIRQLLTESVVLSFIGGALGLGVGAAILDAAPALIPQGMLPPTVALAFDMRVVAFCAGAALLVGLLFGVMPAWQATDVSFNEVLGSENRGTTGGGGRFRQVLVAGEVAMAVLLLFGAGLLLRTLIAVESFDRGYQAESVLSMLVDPLGSKYPTPQALQQFFDQVEEQIRAVPDVKDVAWASSVPFGPDQSDGNTFSIVGDPPFADSERPALNTQVVSHTYFSTLDLPIVQGRAFDTRDTLASTPVCVINEAFARQYFGGRSPIGRQIAISAADGPQDGNQPAIREIIGVAKQVKGRPDEPKDLIQYYAPLTQALLDDIYLVVRPKPGIKGDAMAPAVRAAIGRVDTERLVSLGNVTTLENLEWRVNGRHRFRAVLVIAFAVLALVLAMVGVFGILAYSVQQRMRDFGVRRALGATTNDVMSLVVGNAVRVIVAGAAVGLVLSAMFGRLLVSVLFGVQPLDLATFIAVTVLLAITAALSVAGPAMRAARIDPAVVLRSK